VTTKQLKTKPKKQNCLMLDYILNQKLKLSNAMSHLISEPNPRLNKKT